MYESVLRTGAATVAGYTGVVWVIGPDAVSFLDGLLSQNIAAMQVGTVQRSLLLAPTGKLRAALWVLRGDGAVGLAADARVTETVAQDLSRFKVRVDVAISVETRPVWEIWGPDAIAAAPAPVTPGTWVEESVLVGSLGFRHSGLGRVLVIGDPGPLPQASAAEVAAFRLEVGEPIMGLDLDYKTIPQEAFELSDAVDFTKGCYLGQELVARIDSRGHVNRRLACVLLPDVPTTLPVEVVAADRVIGLLTSAAWSVGSNAAIGLALIRVEAADGAAVAVAGQRGTIVAIPVLP